MEETSKKFFFHLDNLGVLSARDKIHVRGSISFICHLIITLSMNIVYETILILIKTHTCFGGLSGICIYIVMSGCLQPTKQQFH